MDLQTKKACEHFFWDLQIVSIEFYNHYCPWNKHDEKVDYKSREKERRTRNVLQSKPQKKQKVSLKKLERIQRIRDERLERIAYDSKSVEKIGGIVEQIGIIIFFEIINKNHVHIRYM